jgi:hypothetical protein
MRYCPDCGTGHDCEAGAEGRTDPGVEIARINADRDVAVAKLQARMQREELETVEVVAEIEADAEVESSAAEAEIVGAALEGGVEPQPEPMVINAPEAIAESGPDDAPPEVEGSAPPEPKHKASGIGFW